MGEDMCVASTAPTLTFERDRKRVSSVIGKLVISIDEISSTKFVFDPP
jgi:hypothetical protein